MIGPTKLDLGQPLESDRIVWWLICSTNEINLTHSQDTSDNGYKDILYEFTYATWNIWALSTKLIKKIVTRMPTEQPKSP